MRRKILNETIEKMMLRLLAAEAMTLNRSFINHNKSEAMSTLKWVLGVGEWGIPFSLACEIAGLNENLVRFLFLKKARQAGIYDGPGNTKGGIKMFYGVTFCHGCDRPATAEDLLRDEWISTDGYWFCPECQNNIEKCVICGEPNWLDNEWKINPDGGIICPDCERMVQDE